MQSAKKVESNPFKSIKRKELILRTANFQSIQNVCNDAYVNKKMIAVCGEPGYGKTLALNYFANVNQNCFLAIAKPSMTAKTFWIEILQSIYAVNASTEALQFKNRVHSTSPIYFILRKVSDALNSLGNSLLIIDEAGKLDDKELAFLHEIRDETKERAGIVLAGPNYWKVNLEMWLKKNRKGIPEIWRRINYWAELQPPTYFEIKKFCEAYDISDLETIKTLQLRNGNFGSLMNEINELLSEKREYSKTNQFKI
jgi:type II secretory pathway predicted ATPase ExeA